MKRRLIIQGLRIGARVAVGLLKPQVCAICGNLLKSRSYRWHLDDGFYAVCPHCNNHLERENSRKAVREITQPDSQIAEVQDDENNRHIPGSVKMYVWRRDRGRCVQCESREKLEYDHIIPVAKGGSNTDRNVQLLCERCNRSKGDEIL